MTQRDNRRQQTFFEDGDYARYRDLLAQAAQARWNERMVLWNYGDVELRNYRELR